MSKITMNNCKLTRERWRTLRDKMSANRKTKVSASSTNSSIKSSKDMKKSKKRSGKRIRFASSRKNKEIVRKLRPLRQSSKMRLIRKTG